MARKAIIIGSCLDLDGSAWDVRESRTTNHGFSLLFGWPAGKRGQGFGGPRIIPTRALYDYFAAHTARRDGSIYDLPAGSTAIKRIRHLLGFDYYLENAEWWLERLDDLTNMTGVHFAAIHGVSDEMVSVVRRRLLGRRIREKDWYREASNAQLLTSNLPRSYVADRLDISVGAVGRLRWLLRKTS